MKTAVSTLLIVISSLLLSFVDGSERPFKYALGTPSKYNDLDDNSSSYFDDADEHQDTYLDSLQLHPLLQIPCAIGLRDHVNKVLPIKTFVDTGSQRTIMSYSCAKRCGLLQHLDRRYAGEAHGVGNSHCNIVGRIPAGLCEMRVSGSDSVPSPAITVIESTGTTTGVELLLGLDFLREHKAVLDLGDESLSFTVYGDRITVPFIRPRVKPQAQNNHRQRRAPQYSMLDRELEDSLSSRNAFMPPKNKPQPAPEKIVDEDLDDSEDDWSDDGETYDMSGL